MRQASCIEVIRNGSFSVAVERDCAWVVRSMKAVASLSLILVTITTDMSCGGCSYFIGIHGIKVILTSFLVVVVQRN